MGVERGERRREELLRAATTCLVRDGWAGLTHRRVAEEAVATVGLVRYHFGSLSGLRTALATEVSTLLIAPFAGALVTTRSTEELVAATTALVREALADRDGGILLAQVVLGSAHYEDVAAIVTARLEESLAALASHLERLEPARTSTTAREAADLLLAAVDGLVLRGIARPGVVVPPIEPLVRAILGP